MTEQENNADDVSSNDTERVLQFVLDREPVNQDAVVAEFGNRGLSALRKLMIDNKVSYTLDWKLATDERGIDTDTDRNEDAYIGETATTRKS